MDTKKKRQRSKYDRVTQLEGRIDYIEGVMYQLFQLTERLLTTLENLDKNKSGQTLSHTKLITFMTLWAYS